VITGVAAIIISAVRFDLRSMLPSRFQLLIRGPKVRWSRNQMLRRSEDRANAKAATSRNGVAGNRGSTTPTTPTATEVSPTNNQRNRIFVRTLGVHHTMPDSGKSGSNVFPVSQFDWGQRSRTRRLHYIDEF